MSTPLEREAFNLLQAYKDEVDTLRSYWGVTPAILPPDAYLRRRSRNTGRGDRPHCLIRHAHGMQRMRC